MARYYMVERATGQVVADTDSLFPEAMTDEGYRFPSHKLGARMFADVDFPEEMEDIEIGKMTRLARYCMIASTNMLGYRDHGQIYAYTSREIGEIVGLSSESKRKRFLAKMLRLNVIRRWQSRQYDAKFGSWYPLIQYYVNPAYFMANGKRLSLDLFLLFKDELTPILPPDIMKEFLRQAKDKAVLKSDATAAAENIIRGGA